MTLALVSLYLSIGALFSLLTNGSNVRGRLLCCFIWPWLVIADGTPCIRWFTHFSGIEVVIEETTALDGSIIQTVRQAGGHEYTRTRGL